MIALQLCAQTAPVRQETLGLSRGVSTGSHSAHPTGPRGEGGDRDHHSDLPPFSVAANSSKGSTRVGELGRSSQLELYNSSHSHPGVAVMAVKKSCNSAVIVPYSDRNSDVILMLVV
jgi:hypothetical protein